LQAGEHRLWGRVGKRFDAGLEAGLLAGGDECGVEAGASSAREQEQRLVSRAGRAEWGRAGEAVALADESTCGSCAGSVRTPLIGSGAGKADVELAGQTRPGTSALKSSLAMTVTFGLSCSTAAKIARASRNPPSAR